MRIELPVNDAAGSCAVATHGVVKRYGRYTALDGVDLQVPDGSVYVLVGHNGAGKSTLLRSLMNLVRTDAGEIDVAGLDPHQRAAEVRAQIGYVPESQDLGYASLPVGRLMEHQAVFYTSWDHAYAQRLSRAFDIDPSKRCGQMSKGQRRRVQLALALAHRPPVLLMDEPGDGLDHVARDRTLSVLTEHLSDSPTTVLISTHRIYEFERLIDHVGLLDGGKLLGQMSRDDLQRMLRRYSVDVPDGWTGVPGLERSIVRRSQLGRSVELTIWGEQQRINAELEKAGAVVRNVGAMSLDEAATELLTMENAA